MSVLPRATRSMRIIALPLTPVSCALGKSVEHLTYYHFVTPPPPKHRGNTWVKWATTKSAELWAGLGRAQEGSWKRKAFLYGERIIDRLDFEELALKSLDPSLGPKIGHFTNPDVKAKPTPVIPLIYPPSACISPLPHLRSLLEKRTPRHKKGFYIWMLAAPLTTPFMLIPIIPNFPFFFCVWRSWSHYRAFKASQYLEAFLEQGAIVPETSADLDAIYAEYGPQKESSPSSSPSQSSSSPSSPNASDPPPPSLLLSREAVPVLEKQLDLPPGSSFVGDVYRALEQARLRVETKQ
ncbi:hypothetical protein A0H81_11034 [Grifola frondosa]|uniref:Mitochondrial K+-H+ exchange-related-domain-containing protein n=1 Tax=Grifola frondosa TaxID=5627 RepID=A0A1C7LWU1_GRIFR|nr:hypothetical protein A0H81_11034 [Grifola frondosa]